MKKEEIISLTTQFFRETKGGTKPEGLSLETSALIFKNMENETKLNLLGMQR